jgi:hypothetical protein
MSSLILSLLKIGSKSIGSIWETHMNPTNPIIVFKSGRMRGEHEEEMNHFSYIYIYIYILSWLGGHVNIFLLWNQIKTQHIKSGFFYFRNNTWNNGFFLLKTSQPSLTPYSKQSNNIFRQRKMNSKNERVGFFL